jgi:hypothetical protein
VTDITDLWTTPFGAEIGWQPVEAFLELGLREHEHLEYREQVDPGGRRDRFVETVAAMANTGGVGLIIIGVAEDAATDRPQRTWLLQPGTVRPQSLESRCRALQPYVPVEIAWASKPGAGSITLVRVPDFWDRPVWVPDRGVLVRQGQSNVPASLDQLRWWLAPPTEHATAQGFDYGFAGYFTSGMHAGPRVNLGLTPSRPWPRTRWDDGSDEILEQAAARWYPDLGQTRIGDNLVQFSVPSDTPEAQSFLRCSPSGAVLRRTDPSQIALADGVADVQLLAGELLRLWRFGLSSVPAVLSEYRGPLTVRFALNGFTNGLWFPARPRGLPRQPLSEVDDWTKTWPDVPQATPARDVAAALLRGLARAFGYRRPTAAIWEAVDGAATVLGEA